MEQLAEYLRDSEVLMEILGVSWKHSSCLHSTDGDILAHYVNPCTCALYKFIIYITLKLVTLTSCGVDRSKLWRCRCWRWLCIRQYWRTTTVTKIISMH